MSVLCFLCQAEDGIRDLVRSRGLGDVYKRQGLNRVDQRLIERAALVGDDDALELLAQLLDGRLRLSLIHI